MKQINSLFCMSLVVFIAACSSGVQGPKKLELCKNSFTGISLDNKNAEDKIDSSKDKDKDFEYQAGRYEHQSVLVSIYDKKADIKMALLYKPSKNKTDGNVATEKPAESNTDKDGEVPFTIECIGGDGFSSQKEALIVSLPFVDSFTITEEGKSLLSTATLKVTIDSRKFPRVTMQKISSDAPVEGSLKNTYSSYENISHFLYKMSETRYESRLQINQDLLDIRGAVDFTKQVETPSFETSIGQ